MNKMLEPIFHDTFYSEFSTLLEQELSFERYDELNELMAR